MIENRESRLDQRRIVFRQQRRDYNAFGAITSDTLNMPTHNESETWTYNSRGRPQSYTAVFNTTPTTPVYSYNISSYAPNGNVLAVNDSANGNWTYSYDQFNRLVGSNKNSGQSIFSYVYDRFGNRWQQNGTNSMQLAFTGNSPANPQNNNRMDGYSYDAAGNLKNDGTHNYFYDAENRLLQVDGTLGTCASPTTACYSYDPDGNRVQKISNVTAGGQFAGTTQFIYDQSGRWVEMFSGTLVQGNIFLGSRHLAEDGGGTNISHSDWLGTERVRVYYQNNAVCESISSLPFGDGQTTTGACYHSSQLHFTGKPRDGESGLDYFGARFNSSSFGRFTSPDAFWKDSHVGDPQSWNKYAYARNNPLRYIDPTGGTATVATNCSKDGQGNQVCNVTVTATIAIYATGGSGLTQEQLGSAANIIKGEIESSWEGSFTGQDENGNNVTYNVSTQVSVQVAGSQDAAMQSGAQNVIGLSNGDPHDLGSVTNNGKSGMPDTGTWNYQDLKNSAAHEFSHLVGMEDRDSGNSIANHMDHADFATSADLKEAFGGVVSTWNGNYNTSSGDTGGLVQRGGTRIMVPGSGPQTVRSGPLNLHGLTHWWEH